MRIDVTDADILNGEAADCERCPIALAISRVVPPLAIVRVQPGFAYINDWEFRLPPEANDFITQYDEPGHDGLPSPFSFNLPISFDSSGKLVMA